MTTVPSQKTQAIEVGGVSPGFRDARTPSGAFDRGGKGLVQAGSDLASLGDTAGNLALQMQREDNDAEATDKDNAVAEAIRTIVYGDPGTGQLGYYASQGKNALAEYGPAEDAMREAVEKIVGSSSNGAVGRSAGKLAASRLDREIGKMTTHAQTERVVDIDNSGEAREAQAASDAGDAWNDPNIMSRSLGIVQSEVDAWAERHGVSAEEKEFRMEQRQGIVVKRAFDAAIASEDIVTATSILAQNSDLLDSATRTDMTKTLAADALASEAQTLAASALAKFDTPAEQRQYIRDVSSGKTEDAALNNLNDQINEARGDFRFEQAGVTAAESKLSKQRALDAEARAVANHLNTLKTRADKEALSEASKLAHNFLYDETATTPRTMRQFRRENPVAYDELAASDKIEGLVRTQRSIQEGSIYATSSDGVTLSTIMQMDVLERSRVDPNVERPKLIQSEYNKLVTAVAAARDDLQGLAEDKPSYNAGRSAIQRTLPKSYLRGSAGGQSEAERQGIAEANAEMEVFVMGILASGRKPTDPELNAKAAELAVKVTSDPWGFSVGLLGEGRNAFSGLAVQASSMTAAQRSTAIVPLDNIPPVINDTINNWLELGGISDISDSFREELAGAAAVRDKARVKQLLKDAQEAQ